MNVPDKTRMSEQTFADIRVLDIHVENIRHEPDILASELFEQSGSLIEVVYKIYFVAIHRFYENGDPVTLCNRADLFRGLNEQPFRLLPGLSISHAAPGAAYIYN